MGASEGEAMNSGDGLGGAGRCAGNDGFVSVRRRPRQRVRSLQQRGLRAKGTDNAHAVARVRAVGGKARARRRRQMWPLCIPCACVSRLQIACAPPTHGDLRENRHAQSTGRARPPSATIFIPQHGTRFIAAVRFACSPGRLTCCRAATVCRVPCAMRYSPVALTWPPAPRGIGRSREDRAVHPARDSPMAPHVAFSPQTRPRRHGGDTAGESPGTAIRGSPGPQDRRRWALVFHARSQANAAQRRFMSLATSHGREAAAPPQPVLGPNPTDSWAART